ncbi:hypothetical protein [Sulfurimonas paralvinellae]|uniref:Uncharacterized protein n=1 Tax=Sulfurimonas paralvinellae TaxID=317658 RepID=A0A7M1BC07_9BACT|nr:hypothetical protein [Sulfurimonas paralvinellae]QOP46322.1 hypothetical protein FM071_08480 [Sulfurimonas paralvinellae]
MLESLIEDRDFAKMMKKHMQELMSILFQKDQNFGILCKIEDVTFNPELPDDMNAEFRPLTLFFLAGYTFETAQIEDDMLIFEAGFGSDNFGSVVAVPLLSILQIIVDETPIFINIAVEKEDVKEKEKSEVDENGVKNSMASFLSNPENSKFLKKK